jgi:hypothetical protein
MCCSSSPCGLGQNNDCTALTILTRYARTTVQIETEGLTDCVQCTVLPTLPGEGGGGVYWGFLLFYLEDRGLASMVSRKGGKLLGSVATRPRIALYHTIVSLLNLFANNFILNIYTNNYIKIRLFLFDYLTFL